MINHEINVGGTLNVFEVSRIYKVKKIIFPSKIFTFSSDISEPLVKMHH